MTDAQKSALLWLRNRNADGVFQRNGTLLAAGDIGPVMRSTWKHLISLGHLETYDGKRVRVTESGLRQDLSGVEESFSSEDTY